MNFPNFSKFPAKRSLIALFIQVVDFAVRPFHFVKFEPEAPGRNLEQRSMPGLLLPAEGGSSAAGEWRRSTRSLARIHGTARLGTRRLVVAWPRAPVAMPAAPQAAGHSGDHGG